MKIEGSVAVVTGAGSGIGRELAAALAASGGSVVAGDLDAAGAEETAARIRAHGGSAVGVQADAASVDGIATLIDSARDAFGPVDVYVANAGIMGAPGLGDDDDWDAIIDVNVRAHVRAAQALVPEWLERGGGHFVSVASAAGLLTQIGAAGYSVTKHAAVGFAEWLSITYGDNGIGVSCVCPMGVDTPLLNGILDSADPAARLAGAAVATAGEVTTPDRVAALTVDAIREGRFLVLPPPCRTGHVPPQGQRLRAVDCGHASLSGFVELAPFETMLTDGATGPAEKHAGLPLPLCWAAERPALEVAPTKWGSKQLMANDIAFLQAARLKGRLSPDLAAASTGVDVDTAGSTLAELRDAGYLKGAPDVRLTPQGRERLATLVAEERAQLDHAALAALYEDFDHHNTEVKRIIGDWQLKDGAPNDHDDADYDQAVVGRLVGLNATFQPLVARIIDVAPRLQNYPRRFDDALERVLAGDTSYVARPITDSYHTVWFEFHEELIGLLGLSREEEAAEGRAV